jgi:sulfite reductase (NADPH) hemoprotein beta-component
MHLLTSRFKITIAVPPVNDTDVYAHDIGLIAIKDESTGGLAGFNVLIGGGMGMTHGSKKTYARLGQLLGFSTPQQVSQVCESVMLVQRDNGDRKNRKHARYLFFYVRANDVSLKYTIDDMGLEEFKRQVEERLGWKLPSPRDHTPFTKNIDDFSGWAKGDDGLYSHTIFIENGKIRLLRFVAKHH